MTRLHRYPVALYFLAGHSFRGCARKFGCTVREAEEAFRWVSRHMRKAGWKP